MGHGPDPSAAWLSRPMDFEQLALEIGQSPDPLSTTRALRGAGIELPLVHRALANLTLVQPEGRPGGAASNSLTRQGGQGSAIPTRLRPGQRPFPAALAERRCEGG